MVYVSIIIPTKNTVHLLADCLFSIYLNTDDVAYEVILVDNGTDDPKVLEFYQAIQHKYKIVMCPSSYNFAQQCNEGVKHARGEMLLFLNNDTKPTPKWLSEMIALYEEKNFMEPVGTVGSKLLFPDGRIQHIGQIFRYSDKVPTHLFYGMELKDAKVIEMANKVRHVTGNTAACLLVSRKAFDDVEGFDIKYRNGFEDIDFNCKLTEKNYNHLYCPTSLVYHIEHGTLKTDPERDRVNLTYFFSKWGNKMRRVEKG